MTRQLSLWHSCAWHSGAHGEYLHPAVGGFRDLGSVASAAPCLIAPSQFVWKVGLLLLPGSEEIGCGNPLGVWHAPLPGTISNQPVSWHLWVTGNRTVPPGQPQNHGLLPEKVPASQIHLKGGRGSPDSGSFCGRRERKGKKEGSEGGGSVVGSAGLAGMNPWVPA